MEHSPANSAVPLRPSFVSRCGKGAPVSDPARLRSNQRPRSDRLLPEAALHTTPRVVFGRSRDARVGVTYLPFQEVPTEFRLTSI